jgi:hypothetical protein
VVVAVFTVASGQWPVLGAGFIFALEMVLNAPTEVWERVRVGRSSPSWISSQNKFNEAGGFGIPLRAFRTRIGVSPSPLPSLESSR